MEPWYPWENQSQNYLLEAWSNNKWIKVIEGKTGGSGITVPFTEVKAQKFRLTVENMKGKAILNEVLLYN